MKPILVEGKAVECYPNKWKPISIKLKQMTLIPIKQIKFLVQSKEMKEY